jgi:formylglycine-generating enzyme required for sulfatase activity
MLRFGTPDPVWPMLRHTSDPSARSHLIHRFRPLDVNPIVLARRLDKEIDSSIRRALMLGLGEYPAEELPKDLREDVIHNLFQAYQRDPDSGIHGAAEWLLRQWGQHEQLAEMAISLEESEEQLQSREARDVRQWYINTEGQTMVILRKPADGPIEFLMGSPATQTRWWFEPYEPQHRREINRNFAMAATEVTVAQFQRFQPSFQPSRQTSPEPTCPVATVTWYEAVSYCNWLSQQTGISRDQWCYEPNEQGQYAVGMKLAPNYLQRTGYRLPTEAEWEYACRAGSTTTRYYGDSAALLGEYAWYMDNCRDEAGLFRTWPVASLKPNDFGLFDLLGNLFEWCNDRHAPYLTEEELFAHPSIPTIRDEEDERTVVDHQQRVGRGGSFMKYGAIAVRSASRARDSPTSHDDVVGFRPARTYPSASVPP